MSCSCFFFLVWFFKGLYSVCRPVECPILYRIRPAPLKCISNVPCYTIFNAYRMEQCGIWFSIWIFTRSLLCSSYNSNNLNGLTDSFRAVYSFVTNKTNRCFVLYATWAEKWARVKFTTLAIAYKFKTNLKKIAMVLNGGNPQMDKHDSLEPEAQIEQAQHISVTSRRHCF